MPSERRGRSTETSEEQKPSGWRRARAIVRTIVRTIAFIVVASLVAIVVTFWYYGRDLPEVDELRGYAPPQTTRVVDRHGELIGEVFRERRTVVPMERIPRVLVLSVLAAEDADFYQHQGMDYPGMVRGLLLVPLSGRRPQGASTITQQVIKLLLLTPERTVARKVKELVLARRLEEALSKDEILHLYLNHINFGHGRYGVQEAAQYYFGKDVDELSLAEASLIAGIPQAPSRLSPRSHPDAARRRQLFVLSQLEAKRAQYWPDLTVEEIEEAREADVSLRPSEPSGGAPDIAIVARRILRERVGEDAFRRGGYTVHTSIDLALQRTAREALRGGLSALDERQGYRAPLKRSKRPARVPRVDELRAGRTYLAAVTGTELERGQLELDVGGHPAVAELARAARYDPDGVGAARFAEPGARVHVTMLALPDAPDEPATAALELGPQGAVIVLDPRTRDVLALVGGWHADAGFNRATQAVRQPGSTFKPIVYAYGVHTRRLTPATTMIDAPAVYDQWRPQNYETWRYEGEVRLREAVARSINLVAVRAIEDLGPPEVIAFARRLGLTTELEPTLALALGASDVQPLELVNAYATFAAGGRWAPPRIVTRIVGPDGEEVPLADEEAPRDVLTPAEAFVVTSLLSSVITDGTARAARQLGRPAAGKTGTSNEARDAWFVGYTASLVAGVWVGFDDRRPLGRRESGARAALPIWIDVMRAAHEGRRVVDLPVPSGVVTARIDPASGLLAPPGMEDAIEEVFLDGTVPTETARPRDVADPNTFLMEQLDGPAEAPVETPVEGPAEGPVEVAP